MAHSPTLATLVYAIDGDRVLLHRRVKAPNLGLWIAPGGKLEADESPTECARRELREETGLEAERVELRGILAEVSPRADYQWLTFVFVSDRYSGELAPAPGIGEFRWVALRDVLSLDIPPTDRIFFPRVMRRNDPAFLLKFTYDADLRIVRMDEEESGGGPATP